MAEKLVERAPYSMFSKTPVYSVNGETVHGLMQDPVVPDASDDMFTVKDVEGSRLDTISENFYGTPQLWWVLARVNNIQDPMLGVRQGTKIRIPLKSRLATNGVLDI